MPHDVAADMHMHTVASDGTCTVDDRVQQAREKGLDAIAVTDHDTIPTDLTDRVETRNGVELVTGCELRAGYNDTKIEILGYFIDPSNERLQDACSQAEEYRHERNKELVERVNAATGLNLSYEALAEEVNMLGRPHIAQKLVEHDVVNSIQDAFDAYLADPSCYVPMQKLPVEDVIDVIHAADGVASIAHPGRIRSDNPTAVIEYAVKQGVDGIEAWYPYSGTYEPDHPWVREAHRLADEYKLLKTGGSDCHGPGSEKHRISNCGMPREAFTALKQAAGL